MRALLVVIVSFLTEEARDSMLYQGLNLLIKSDKQPLFNYISFCRHLYLSDLEAVIHTIKIGDQSKWFIIKTEIFKLFINGNMKYKSLFITQENDYQIHLFPGFKICFSELESLCCCCEFNQNILNGLADVCKLIRKLEIYDVTRRRKGLIKLIKSQIKLADVCIELACDDTSVLGLQHELIKHSNTIRHLTISDDLISMLPSFTELQSLKIVNHSYQTTNLQILNISNQTSLQRLV